MEYYVPNKHGKLIIGKQAYINVNGVPTPFYVRGSYFTGWCMMDVIVRKHELSEDLRYDIDKVYPTIEQAYQALNTEKVKE